MVSRLAPPTSQGQLEPKLQATWLILCSIRSILQSGNAQDAITFSLPLCSQVKGFGPVVSDSLLSQAALPALSSAERQWMLERLHPWSFASAFYGEEIWNETAGHIETIPTHSFHDCHAPWPYGDSWSQKLKQKFPTVVDTSGPDLCLVLFSFWAPGKFILPCTIFSWAE